MRRIRQFRKSRLLRRGNPATAAEYKRPSADLLAAVQQPNHADKAATANRPADAPKTRGLEAIVVENGTENAAREPSARVDADALHTNVAEALDHDFDSEESADDALSDASDLSALSEAYVELARQQQREEADLLQLDWWSRCAHYHLTLLPHVFAT